MMTSTMTDRRLSVLNVAELRKVHHNLHVAPLVEQALLKGEGRLASNGAGSTNRLNSIAMTHCASGSLITRVTESSFC